MNWSSMPFVRILPAFISGILLSLYFSIEEFYFLFIIAGAFILIVTGILHAQLKRYKTFQLSGFSIYICVLIIGLSMGSLSKNNTYNQQLQLTKNTNTWIVCDLIKPIEKQLNSNKVVCKIVFLKDSVWTKTNEKVILYFKNKQHSNNLNYGDRLLLSVTLKPIEPPANPEEFNYKNYLAYKGIHFRSYVNTFKWKVISSNNGYTILRIAYSIRNNFIQLFEQSNLPDETTSIATALIIGNRSSIDSETLNVYAGTGVLHIISVSGLHVGIIFLVLNSLLTFLDKRKKTRIFKLLFITCIIWLYAFVTGLDSPVLRSTIMITFIAVAQLINRKANIFNTVAASAFLLLLINPLWIMDVGFQFSYLAVAGIIIVHTWLYELWQPNNTYITKIWGLICVSLSAQLFTFSLGLLYFHQFPNYFLIANLLVIPLSTCIMLSGILFAITFPITYLSSITSWILIYLIKLMNGITTFIFHLPYAVFNNIYITKHEVLLSFILIISIIIYVANVQKKYLFIALTALLLISMSFSARSIQTSKQKLFTAFNIKNTQAFAYINGHKAIVYTSDTTVNFSKKFNYHIKPMLLKHQVEWVIRDIK